MKKSKATPVKDELKEDRIAFCAVTVWRSILFGDGIPNFMPTGLKDHSAAMSRNLRRLADAIDEGKMK